jgi:hypothetical protein
MPVEHFKSDKAYRKYRAYVHLRGIKTHAKRVCIKGNGCHTVKHSKKAKGGQKRVA